MGRLSSGTDTQAHNSLNDLQWRKSKLCGGGECVEFAQVDKDTVAIRDSKSPDKSPLLYSATEWATFVQGVKNGEFDV